MPFSITFLPSLLRILLNLALGLCESQVPMPLVVSGGLAKSFQTFTASRIQFFNIIREIVARLACIHNPCSGPHSFSDFAKRKMGRKTYLQSWSERYRSV